MSNNTKNVDSIQTVRVFETSKTAPKRTPQALTDGMSEIYKIYNRKNYKHAGELVDALEAHANKLRNGHPWKNNKFLVENVTPVLVKTAESLAQRVLAVSKVGAKGERTNVGQQEN